jgi:hypothetical protein
MFSIAFEVESEHTEESVTASELRYALMRRVNNLLALPNNDFIEAIGAAEDTYEVH